MHRLVLVGLASLLTAWTASAQQLDPVLKGGRVVDPETGLDAVRDGVAPGRPLVADMMVK